MQFMKYRFSELSDCLYVMADALIDEGLHIWPALNDREDRGVIYRLIGELMPTVCEYGDVLRAHPATHKLGVELLTEVERFQCRDQRGPAYRLLNMAIILDDAVSLIHLAESTIMVEGDVNYVKR